MSAPESPPRNSRNSRNPRNLPDVYRPLWQQGGSWARRQLIRALVSIEVQLENWLAQLEKQQVAEPNRVTLRSLVVTAIARFWLGLLRQWRLWNTALFRLKQRIPWLRKIPNGVLTLIAALIVAGVIWAVIAFWPSSPQSPERSASSTTPEPTATTLPSSQPAPFPIPPGASSTEPSARIPTDTAEEPTPALPTLPAPPGKEPERLQETEGQTAGEPIIPAQPSDSTPTQGNTPPTEPSPPLEQRLLSQLRARLKERGDRPAAELLQSIQAAGAKLVTVLTLDWSTLSAAEQDALATRLQDLSSDQGFERLELVDQQGHLLARSPVVGERMVILRRSR